MDAQFKTDRPLPEGYSLSKGVLTDPEGYRRNVADKNGRIDTLAVIQVLQNSDYFEHAKRWYQTRAEANAHELYEVLKEVIFDLEKRGINFPSAENAKSVLQNSTSPIPR